MRDISTFPNLIAELIAWTFPAPGSAPTTQSGVRVDIGAVVRLDTKLQVGKVEEKVNVTGEAPSCRSTKSRWEAPLAKGNL